MVYAPMRGSFTEKGVKDFLRDLSYGKGQTVPVRGNKLPTVEARDPWDGKDGEVMALV